MTAFPQETVKRATKAYKATGMDLMNDLDLMAGFLLKLMATHNISYYADGREKDPATIKKADPWIGYDCVAIAFDEDNRLYAASNSHKLKREHIETLLPIIASELEFHVPSFHVVVEGDKNEMHAEMQLLSSCLHRNIPPTLHFLGVSKPCCDQCAEVLIKHNVKFSTRHTSKVVNWQNPT